MTIRIFVLSLACAIASSSVADQRLSFERELEGDLTSAFSCDCYTIQREGPGKMIWFPTAACKVDSPCESRTCKVWSVMPLRRVEQSATVSGWDCSQKNAVAEMEPSTRYQIQYLGASAETNVTFGGSVEHVFDIDAGDLFAWFGRDASSPLTCLLENGSRREKKLNEILCSSGRIKINCGRGVLMYGLTMNKEGEATFAFSVNGLMDIVFCSFNAKKGNQIDKNGRPLDATPIIHSSSPAISLRLSDPETISLRIAYNRDFLNSADVSCDDIRISVPNLQSIQDWLSKPIETRGVWQATGKCALDQRRIF